MANPKFEFQNPIFNKIPKRGRKIKLENQKQNTEDCSQKTE